MDLKIGFVYDAKDEYKLEEGDSPDKFAEFDYASTIDDIANALKSGNNEVIRIGHAKNLAGRLIGGERFDIIFNIAEGIKGRGREGQAPSILELYDQPYVGSDPVTMGITLDKTLAKKIALYHGIGTPGFVLADKSFSPENFNLNFPVIVKASCEGTSKGINSKSLSRDLESMIENIKEINNKYNQPALVEEFISGQEFTVVVLGNENPQALPPVHIMIAKKLDLNDDFYTYERVFSDDIDYICPAKASDELQNLLKDISARMHKFLGCRDFSRMDFRVDNQGRPFFLECNPLPNLGMGDVFPLVAKACGMNYNDIILKILDHAIKRYNLMNCPNCL